MNVADIMSRKVHTVSPDENLAELKTIFSSVKYRHLLVEENNRLIGVISDRDALAHLSPFLETTKERENDRSQLSLQVRHIMTTHVITVDPDTTIDCASILLLENSISCLPVVTADMTIEGILSWKDILLYHVYGLNQTVPE